MYRNSGPGTVFLQVTHLLELAHAVPCGAHECGEQQAAQFSRTRGRQGHRGTCGGWKPPSAVGGGGPLGAQASHCRGETCCLGLRGV